MVSKTISARAVIPDQLLEYVAGVSGLDSEMIDDCVLHHGDGQGVLVAYPLHDPLDYEASRVAMQKARSLSWIENLTVLAPIALPGLNEVARRDTWWQLPIPTGKPGQKLRNMLKRAGREVKILKGTGIDTWQPEHDSLVAAFCERRKNSLDDGLRYIYAHLTEYLKIARHALLFSARDVQGKLAAFAIGDYSAMGTAFYMFAFRDEGAPPGTADLLLAEILREAGERGCIRVNLGLGIDKGIEFFKKKWGATEYLPYVEFELAKPAKSGFWRRLLGMGK